ncbi:MAG: relaxase/mobilization nuclease domain-containing protein [Alphaproteobacteria bacterium]|nr:relaxase/mobilization nuclease domain-containing protein [Alphaproteobacteria bacterium]
MISKKVQRETVGKFRGLANYIAAAKEKGEKLHSLWMVNCNAGEERAELNVAIAEIEAIQEGNTRAHIKTYHLIVSFQQGESLPQEQLAEIERKYAKSLGFDHHQRVVGAHQNTDNFHLHVAYNMIHPETLKIHHPYNDYLKLSQTCRAVEQQYGLQGDHGMETWKEWRDKRDCTPERAKDMEAHRWEQSFHRFVKEVKQPILDGIQQAGSWSELHQVFADQDLVGSGV